MRPRPRTARSILPPRAVHRPLPAQHLPFLQSRPQSQSQGNSDSSPPSPPPSPSPSPPRPTFSRAKLAAFAAEGELLTSPSRAPPPIRPVSSTAHQNESVTRNPSLPRPILKSNPYASNYTVSDADLDAAGPFDPPPELGQAQSSSTKSEKQTSPHAQGQKTASQSAHQSGSRLQRLLYRARARTSTTPSQTDSHDGSIHEDNASVGPHPGGRQGRGRSFINRGRNPTSPQTAKPRRLQTIELTPSDSITVHDGYITYSSEAVGAKDQVISFSRLRDACTCKHCRDQSTKQMILTTGQAVAEAKRRPVFKFYQNSHGPHLMVKWNLAHTTTTNSGTEPEPSTDINDETVTELGEGGEVTGHQDSQPHAQSQPDASIKPDPSQSHEPQHHVQILTPLKIRQLGNPALWDSLYKSPSFSRRLWDRSTLEQSGNLRIPYAKIAPHPDQTTGSPSSATSAAMLKMLEQLQVYGLVVITGVPTDPTSNKDCWLRKVVNQIGEIRNTFYGETWDVKSVKQSKNVAYTDLDLGLHMDLLYFSSPPRFQALHCLRNRVNGGTSYFVDSFKVVTDLPPTTFRLLRDHKIPYIYDNDDHFLRYRHPVISWDFASHNPHAAVNWSPPFRAMGDPIVINSSGSSSHPNANGSSGRVGPSPGMVARKENEVYDAIGEFESRLAEDKYKYSFTLKEGDLVLFDNRRVLHARTSFADKTDEERAAQGIEVVEGEPTRWLKGCYIEGEAVWDKLATLKRHVAEQSEHRKAETILRKAQRAETKAKAEQLRREEQQAFEDKLVDGGLGGEAEGDGEIARTRAETAGR